MIQAVILDWGGVLMRTLDLTPRLKWDARLGPTSGADTIARLVFESGDWRRAQAGQISEEMVWTHLGARLQLAPEALAELRHDFWAGDRLDGELLALIRRLRPRFKTALLSNFPSSLRTLLAEQGVSDAFDLVIISGEEGIVKPDPRIFRLAAQRLGVPIGDCLFVDDFVENIQGARAAGMQTLHFAPPESVIAELKRLTLDA
jgi:epoxide hydrolase-like predicted phosphatase